MIYPLQIMILVFMYAMLGVAWNIMGGYAGMFSFGQAAFFGIGAYTSSFLLMTFHVNPWIGLIAGGVVAALVAAAIGYPCSNLRGHYFAIASIAFAEIVRVHFNNWTLMNAAEGISLTMLDESFINFMFHTSKVPYYYIMLAFLILALIVCYFVATSKMGYYFRAIKESHDVAEVLGVNVVRYRLIAIMISAIARASAAPENRSRAIARASTEVAQAPAAWMTRPISRLGRSWASPHQRLPARNTAKPVKTGQRLP